MYTFLTQNVEFDRVQEEHERNMEILQDFGEYARFKMVITRVIAVKYSMSMEMYEDLKVPPFLKFVFSCRDRA